MSHARHNPSGYAAWKACPGQLAAIAALPPDQQDTENDASRLGTKRHALLAHMLNDAIAGQPQTWPTEILDDEMNRLIIDSDDVELVKPLLNYVLRHPAFINRNDPWCGVHVERKVHYGSAINRETVTDDFYGHADVILVTQDALEVVDAKFGRHPVRAKNNDQGKLYLLGAGALLDWNGAHRQVREVKFTILQPTLSPDPDVWTQPANALMEWSEEAKLAIARTEDPNAPRIPDPDKQCFFCPAGKAGACPELQAAALSAMQNVFGGTADSAPAPINTVDAIVDIADVKMTRDPEAMSNDELAKALDQQDVVIDFFKRCRTLAEDRADKGEKIPGWKRVEGKRARDWAEGEETTVKKLTGFPKIKKSDCYIRKFITPAAAEKLGKGVGLTDRQMDRLKSLWTWKAGKPTLVPESDARPEIIPPAGEMFDAATASETHTKPETEGQESWL